MELYCDEIVRMPVHNSQIIMARLLALPEELEGIEEQILNEPCKSLKTCILTTSLLGWNSFSCLLCPVFKKGKDWRDAFDELRFLIQGTNLRNSFMEETFLTLARKGQKRVEDFLIFNSDEIGIKIPEKSSSHFRDNSSEKEHNLTPEKKIPRKGESEKRW